MLFPRDTGAASAQTSLKNPPISTHADWRISQNAGRNAKPMPLSTAMTVIDVSPIHRILLNNVLHAVEICRYIVIVRERRRVLPKAWASLPRNGTIDQQV